MPLAPAIADLAKRYRAEDFPKLSKSTQDIDGSAIGAIGSRSRHLKTGWGKPVNLWVSVAELERNLILERVRAGMRRAKTEGRQIGRPALDLGRAAILSDSQSGRSLS